MEIRDLSSMKRYAEQMGEGARVTQVYPAGGQDGLLAVDLWEIEPGGRTSLHAHAEEHVLFVIGGEGELSGEGGSAARVRADSVVYVGPHEAYTLRNTGRDALRVLVSTPLLVRSDRMLGRRIAQAASVERKAEPEAALQVREAAAGEPAAQTAPTQAAPTPAGDGGEEPAPDISKLMKRGSDLVGAPRPERRRPTPEPEPEPAAAEPQQAEAEVPQPEQEEAEERGLMELFVAFDGGSRGNPGEGYGSFMVQAPGRKPVVRRLEFGPNYTNNQAEYDSLIECLKYVIERLTATGRSPDQMQLDIRSDSDLVVNQLLGTYKVKEAGLRKRHQEATALLEQFADWRIEWHPREESVRLLGH